MTETVETITNTNEIVINKHNKQMFVFDIKHTEIKSASPLFKIAHAECFAEQYKCPPNYLTSVDREVTNARATCEFCGLRLDPIQAEQEESAIKKWLSTGDRSDYAQVISERNTRTGITTKTRPVFKQSGATTGRMSANRPNMTEQPRSNAADVLAQLKRQSGVTVTGIESDGVSIVTHREQALSDMSRMSDEELFGKK